MKRLVAAVDLGATSGRVMIVELTSDRFESSPVHRFDNPAVRGPDGSLRWDWPHLVREVKRGLDAAIDRGEIASIGIDAWGVDYGLLTEEGNLVSRPYHYRDERTIQWREIVGAIGPERIYAITGIQMMPVNTLVQLAVHDPAEIGMARWLLTIPELMIHSLCSRAVAEHTSASTTQLLEASSRTWSTDLIREVGMDPAQFPKLLTAGSVVGDYRGVAIRLVGGHDTASAVVAVPSTGGGLPAYLSSGTWSLIGCEVETPQLGRTAFELNFTNEAGAFGEIRLLKNVMGLWMLDECLREWNIDIEQAIIEAKAGAGGPIVDATDERFLKPPSMQTEIRAAARGLAEDRGSVVRCILDSLAAAYARVLNELEAVVGVRPDVLHIIGGGSRLNFLNQLTAAASEMQIVVGPTEATALGNAIVQMIAEGWIPDIASARQLVAAG